MLEIYGTKVLGHRAEGKKKTGFKHSNASARFDSGNDTRLLPFRTGLFTVCVNIHVFLTDFMKSDNTEKQVKKHDGGKVSLQLCPFTDLYYILCLFKDFIKNIINDTEINDQTVKVVQSKKLETPHTARQNNVIE